MNDDAPPNPQDFEDVDIEGPSLPHEKSLDNCSTTIAESDASSAPSSVIGSARTPWYYTALIIVAEVMGTGVLSLPYSAATLGWVTTMVALPLFAVFAGYSAWLLSKVKEHYPEFTSYSDAATGLVGPRFGLFTKMAMILNWGALAIYFLITISDSIGVIHNQGYLACQVNRTTIAALLLILPTQCRDFHTISKFLSLPSTMAVLVTIIIIVASLIVDHVEAQGGDDHAPSFTDNTTVGPQAGTNPLSFFEALGAFIFAYQGQSIFMELMSEMKDSKKFPKSCNFANAIMFLVYTFTVVSVYGLKGNEAPGFLPDILKQGAARATVGILLTFHVLVSYVITGQPLQTWFQSVLFPKSTMNPDSFRATLDWFIVSAGYILFAFFVANLIPFFSEVQSFIGALFGAPIMFGWPALFYVAVNKQKAGTWKATLELMGWSHAALCFIFLCVLTPLLAILGSIGAVVSIVEDSEDSSPFSC